MKNSKAKAYKEAGVDINAGYQSVKQIKPLIELTKRKEVLGSIGGFGGLFNLDLKNLSNPVLVSGTDGVGTKLKLAFDLDKHDSIGIDCVAMCVNDIICSGAEPLFFLDYIACSNNNPDRITSIVKGIADGCIMAGCSLVGGETAEMPGFYQKDEYDIAGFAVGIVDKSKIIDGSKVSDGDIIIGLGSSGIHSNGFSLIRKILNDNHISLNEKPEVLKGLTVGESLLRPTKIYVKPILNLIKENLTPLAICHITGGGFYENIPRALPEGLEANINLNSFPKPAIYSWLEKTQNLTENDLYSTFNMGIGMILIVKPDKVDKTLQILKENNEQAFIIGKIQAGNNGVVLTK